MAHLTSWSLLGTWAGLRGRSCGNSLCCRSMALQLPHRNSPWTGLLSEGTWWGCWGGSLGGVWWVPAAPHALTHCALADCSITKFLNRILGLEVDKQNMLFQYFSDTFDYLIEKDKKEGKYDMGILGMEKEEWPQICLLHPSSS